MSQITPVRMPKWGLSMQEGKIVHWWKSAGDRIMDAEDLVDIETSKITNVCESPIAGTLRRITAQIDETLPVGALIAVIAEAEVSEAAIDAFIADFNASFVPPASDDTGADAMALSMVQVGSQSLRMGSRGEGEGVPVVLIHGFGGDLNNWLFNVEAIAAEAPVLAFDLPGHGGSSKAIEDGRLAGLAKAITDALKSLAISKAHLVGHSLGASVAAHIAANQPGLVASLTLICPASLAGNTISKAFIEGMVEAERAKDIKPLMEMLVADPAMITKAMVDDIVKFKRLDGVETGLSAIGHQLLGQSDAKALQADLAKIPSALVIASAKDQIVGTPDASALPPGFKLVLIDGAGHMPHLEKSNEVNALILQAIRA